MKETLEKLWNEYLAEECAVIDTEEEKRLAKKAAEKHDIANDLLTKEQSDIVEDYVDAVCEIQGCFSKKAFFKGCEFTASFLLEVGSFKKNIKISSLYHSLSFGREAMLPIAG
ncbi:MAG: hypothetical protein IJY50_01080 [Clostridia bacterium]|nr:hypothetical protein [Clostridia bacterium]